MKRILPAVAMLFVSMPAFAAEGGLFAQKLGIQIADFLVVIVPLLIILIPVVRKSLIKRHDEVKASIDAAKAEYESCSARLKVAEDQLRDVNEKMESIRKSFRDLAADERKALELEATETAVKLRREAEMRLNHAALTTKAELAEEVVNRALALVQQRARARHPSNVADAAIDMITNAGE